MDNYMGDLYTREEASKKDEATMFMEEMASKRATSDFEKNKKEFRAVAFKLFGHFLGHNAAKAGLLAIGVESENGHSNPVYSSLISEKKKCEHWNDLFNLHLWTIKDEIKSVKKERTESELRMVQSSEIWVAKVIRQLNAKEFNYGFLMGFVACLLVVAVFR